MRLAKTIALIVASAVVAGFSYETAMPMGWCGSCPLRSFTIPGTAGKLRIVEWGPYSRQTTWLCFGSSYVDVPIRPYFAVMTFVTLAGVLAGFAPSHRQGLRLLGFVSLAFVFTIFAAHFAANAGTLLGFLGEPLPTGIGIWRFQAVRTPWLLSLTMTAAIVSCLASFRVFKKFASQDFDA